MAKYRKKPIIVECEQLTIDHIKKYLFEDDKGALPKGVTLYSANWNTDLGIIYSYTTYVTTINGDKVPIIEGDWVMKETDGIHHYPCKDVVFQNTYEEVADTPP